MAEELGYLADERGYMPEERGYMMEERGYMAEECGYMPEECGYTIVYNCAMTKLPSVCCVITKKDIQLLQSYMSLT